MLLTVEALRKRRRMMFYIVFALSLVGILIDNIFTIEAISYFEDAQTNMYMVYFLIGYKLVELNVLYIFFYKRNLVKYYASEHTDDLVRKFEKNAKRFFMLVPHGNVIFGIISYKLTANIGFFLLFMSIATIALYLVKPKKILDYIKD